MESPTVRSPRYAVNCSILFTELPLLGRPAAVRSPGFQAIEMWWPLLSVVPDDVDKVIETQADRIAHVQVADEPKRNEPGTATLPLRRQLEDLHAGGYRGWVGLEYMPSSTSDRAFDWLSNHSLSNH